MKTTYLTLSLIFTVNILFSQIEINFNNEFNYYTNQIWGDTSKFTTNSQHQLQLNDNQAGEAFIALENPFIDYFFKEWKVDVDLNFSPSSGNYTRIYLYTQDSLVNENSEGLYLQFGESGSNDAIHLIWDDGSAQNLLSSTTALISSSFELDVKLNVDSLNYWRLFTRSSGTAQWIIEDSAQFILNSTNSNFAIFCKYTSSNSTDFYFDNLYLGNVPVDTLGPVLQNIESLTKNQLKLYFNEAVFWTSQSKMYWNGTEIDVVGVSTDSTEKNLYITSSETLSNLDSLVIGCSSINDALGNSSNSQTHCYIRYTEECLPKDLLFNELMIDPSPPIALPSSEYIELFNRSEKCFNLENFRLVNAGDTSILESYWLLPGKHVVLCDYSDSALFSPSLGLTDFPSLINSADSFQLLNTDNLLVDEFSYNSEYFKGDTVAKDGRSLSLFYPNYFCSNEEHWRASRATEGGTPGVQNEGVDFNYDTLPPRIVDYRIIDSMSIGIRFNEDLNEMNSNLIVSLTDNPLLNFTMNDEELALRFTQSFAKSKILSVQLKDVQDCNFNNLSIEVNFVVPQEVLPGDIVINELLFNPPTGGKDFVELYNETNKYLDLSGVSLSKNLEMFYDLPEYILGPNDLVYLSEDVEFLKQHYPFYGDDNFIEMNIPNFNNDSSHVYIVDSNQIIDEVFYSEQMHFTLLEDVDGVSLERIGLDGEANFVSAASSYNFASPGVKNSQFIESKNLGNWKVSPKIFSPNNDGEKDFTSIYYSQMPENTLFNILIYDEQGVLVKALCNNVLGENSGVKIWDGTDLNNQICMTGNYLFYIEIMAVDGSRLQAHKEIVILIGK